MVQKHVRVVIAGSGFAGLGMAIRLKQTGEEDFVVLERSAELGGVWRDNQYPGCACDVESHLYSFSFARNPDWSHHFSGHAEIKAYLEECATRFGVRPHLRFHTEVLMARWSDDLQRWFVETTQGTFTADAFVVATGALSEPKAPAIPGLDRFAGKAFHSARWDRDHDLEGRRVAVIGTGASAIQFVPHIQPLVSRLTIFQRTPPWIVPRNDRRLTERERRWLRASPLLQWLLRARIYATREATALMFFEPRLAKLAEHLARRHLARSIQDPVLRAKLTPSYTIGCKRILLTDDYLPAVAKPNVDLVTTGIREVVPEGVVTTDGTLHAVDTLVYGTGFQVQEYPFKHRVAGREGTLAEAWATGMRAHLGTTVPGFPNLFLMMGPNTGLGHTSVVTMIESQFEHVLKALAFLRDQRATSVEPRPDAAARWQAEVDRKLEGTVWTTGGCKSWYLDETGRNSTLWPGFTFTYKRRVERFEPNDYLVHDRAPAAELGPEVRAYA